MTVSYQCPYCYNPVNEYALKCAACGEYFDDKQIPPSSTAYQIRALFRGFAIVFSVVFPGLGQLFQGRVLWGFAVTALFFFLMTMGCWGMTIYHTMLSIIGFSAQGEIARQFTQRLSLGVLIYIINILDVAYYPRDLLKRWRESVEPIQDHERQQD